MPDELITVEIVDDVYIFRFKNNSRRAAKEYVTKAAEKAREWIKTYGNRPILIILDITKSGLFSISYVNELTRKEMSTFTVTPEIRVAYLTDKSLDEMLINTLNPIIAEDMNMSRNVFDQNELDVAIQWLKSYSSD